jgi:hypothetical protein
LKAPGPDDFKKARQRALEIILARKGENLELPRMVRQRSSEKVKMDFFQQHYKEFATLLDKTREKCHLQINDFRELQKKEYQRIKIADLMKLPNQGGDGELDSDTKGLLKKINESGGVKSLDKIKVELQETCGNYAKLISEMKTELKSEEKDPNYNTYLNQIKAIETEVNFPIKLFKEQLVIYENLA